MKKILFVIPSLTTGGTNSSLDSLYLKLRRRYDIRVFSISHQPRDHNYSFDEVLIPKDCILSLMCSNYASLKGLNKFYAFFLKILLSLLRKINIDLRLLYAKYIISSLETHERYDCIVSFQEGYPTKFTSLFHNQNKIAWIHCNYDFYLSNDKSEESIYKKYKRIVCVSKYTAFIFSNRYPFLASRTTAIHNIIDEVRIRKLAYQPIDDSRFLTDKVAILSVGRFTSVKRFREIPFIASELKSKGILFSWYIIGPDDESGECELFKANSIKYKVEDCVIWLGGKSNPYPFFKQVDLLVCLSESEACPMVFKEAELLGTPIVTTDFPSAYEFITEENGVISPIGNLAEAIISLINKKKNGIVLHKNTDMLNIDKVINLFDYI